MLKKKGISITVITVISIYFIYSVGKEMMRVDAERNNVVLSEQVIEEIGVSIKMPGKPDEKKIVQKMGEFDVPVYMYYVEKKKVTFMVSYFDFIKANVEVPDPKMYFEGSVKGIEEMPGAVIREKKELRYKDSEGIRVMIDSKEKNDIVTETEMFIINKNLYQITVSYVDLDKSLIEDYFNSFTLISDKK